VAGWSTGRSAAVSSPGPARSARPDRTTSPTRWPPAALARAHGLDPAAVAQGLRAFVPDPHRNEPVGDVAGVRYVDDSKATNPHAALASLASYDKVVWVAGGLLKGAPVDELVARVAGRLAGAVLLGADRAALVTAIARHAPNLPVVTVSRTDDGAMSEVVEAAAALGPARRHGAAGAGRRLDGHVPGLQGPRRRVRRGGARAGGPVTATAPPGPSRPTTRPRCWTARSPRCT
jgi:hypothetical protein